MDILYGLIAMTFWGTALFLAALASRKFGNVLTLFWMQLFGFLIAAIYFIFNFQSFNFEPIYKFLPVLLLIAVLQVIAYLAFYKGLEKGQVSLVSPIGSSWGVITAILGVIFYKESLGWLQFLAIILIVAGGVLISLNLSDLIKSKKINLLLGVKEGIISMLGWGVSLFLLVPATKELGWFLPAFIFRLFLLITLGLFILFSQKSFVSKTVKIPLKLLIPIGIFDVGAFFAYSLGVSGSFASIVAPIGGANTVVTILLASLVLKEKMTRNQIIGIIGVVAGLVLIAI